MVRDGDVEFCGVDLDGDEDVLICGTNYYNVKKTRLYSNDGKGNFSLIEDMPFVDIAGKVAFADVDGDADQDLLITGEDSNGNFVTRFYINNTVIVPFEKPVEIVKGRIDPESLAIADVDGDNDLDLMVTKTSNAGDYKLELYINNGAVNIENNQVQAVKI